MAPPSSAAVPQTWTMFWRFAVKLLAEIPELLGRRVLQHPHFSVVAPVDPGKVIPVGRHTAAPAEFAPPARAEHQYPEGPPRPVGGLRADGVPRRPVRRVVDGDPGMFLEALQGLAGAGPHQAVDDAAEQPQPSVAPPAAPEPCGSPAVPWAGHGTAWPRRAGPRAVCRRPRAGRPVPRGRRPAHGLQAPGGRPAAPRAQDERAACGH